MPLAPQPISAVIPNRDGAELLPRILPPLLRELPPDRNEILVIDDGSEDDSVAILRRAFPAVGVIALPVSVGFGAACNRGFQEAHHELVLLLNSDMEVTAGSVELLVEHFADPGVFAAGPAYWSDGPTKPPPASAERPYRRQLGAPAGGGVFRREAFLSLAGFDPLYHPFYWEDLDLGWNAWRQGWPIVYDNRCHFVHLGSATIRRLHSPRYVARIRARNRLLFAWKNLRTPGLFLPFVGRSLGRALRAGFALGDLSQLGGVLGSAPLVFQAIAKRRPRGALTDRAILRESETTFAALNGV